MSCTSIDIQTTRFDYPVVLVRLSNWLVVLTLTFSLGAHWAFLQSVAWTTMLAGNLSTGSFSEAVQKTFDGKHPCCLCKTIAAGKRSEKKSQYPLQKQKLEFPSVTAHFAFIAPEKLQVSAAADSFADSFAPNPPTPPPRGFFV